MSTFNILRIEKRTLQQARAMAEHALRDGVDVPNADPARREANRILVGPPTAEAVMRAIRGALPPRRRCNAVEVVEMLVTFSPEQANVLPPDQQAAYFGEALRWSGERFGGSDNIKSAVVHMDETTPHLQVLLVPLDSGRLRANHFIGGPPGLRRLQTLFAEDVGQRFGLTRGMQRRAGQQKVSHQHVARFYAAITEDDLEQRNDTAERLAYWARVGRMFAGRYMKEMRAKTQRLLDEGRMRAADVGRLQGEVSALDARRQQAQETLLQLRESIAELEEVRRNLEGGTPTLA